ncbi:MAG TPA: prephenate dehydrogenase/arogenate dehydrogenase family protein [Candidatus Polarisedimenticolia bacterium]|nr:prephenate dehydrogenase/arogenate dehydrogenase family protein [Candidatus Polarisedimenticolia bacterium]
MRRSGPPFRRIALVGVGLIGGSIGLALRRNVRSARVVGVDRPSVLRAARARGAIDEAAPSLARGLRGADLVILALPVDGILKTLPRLGGLLAAGAIVTDVGSTKEGIVRRARLAGLGGRFVGGHPMAGTERSGIQHADGTLFKGAAWILCPARGAAAGRAAGRRGGEPAVRRIAGLVRRMGARPEVLDPRAHDRTMARLSHLPQLVSVALTNAAGAREARPFLHLSGPALLRMSRLADSPPDLWEGILRSNRVAVERALDDFIKETGRLRASLGGGPSAHFRRAARLRARLVAGARGRGPLR